MSNINHSFKRGENMMGTILHYCPVCGNEEIKNDYPSRKERTYTNVRDGYGRGIYQIRFWNVRQVR